MVHKISFTENKKGISFAFHVKQIAQDRKIEQTTKTEQIINTLHKLK